MSSKIIDPHVHFFNLAEGQYSWLQGDNPPPWPNLAKIKQPITAEQLIQSSDFELAGLVHIEAGFDNFAPINELNWLASHMPPLPYKAISYARIDQHHTLFCNALNKLTHPSLIGIRDITEGDDATRLLSTHCYNNLATLNHLNLHFEAQFELENSTIVTRVAQYAEQFKQLIIVINHAGLPHNIHAWQQGIALLAKYSNIVIKFSGFELLSLNREQQAQCFTILLQHFGEQRVMFASNFPVCQINASYNELWHAHFRLCDKPSTWLQLSYKNAKHYYQV
jgi:L-fuconolactonase